MVPDTTGRKYNDPFHININTKSSYIYAKLAVLEHKKKRGTGQNRLTWYVQYANTKGHATHATRLREQSSRCVRPPLPPCRP